MEHEPQNENTAEDELSKKHKKERKDLQAKIQALKKTATKGDKKKKKEVAEEIVRLEQELDHKQESELEHTPTSVEPTENDDGQEEINSSYEEPTAKISRAQKRRNKKQVADKEREKRIAEQEETNKQGPRQIELSSIKEILQHEGLQIYNIPADGNCLYCAINHQLEVTGRESLNIAKLRKLTASFIRDNKDEFLPFMYNEDDGFVDESQFEKYCKDIANTKVWGGQLELTALSKILKCPIKVIQASAPFTVQGESFTGIPLTVTYHKHLYRLGEHYNSTTKISENADIDEAS